MSEGSGRRTSELDRTARHYAVRNREYWEVRHGALDELASGGHLGLDHAGNEIFFSLRFGQVLAALGDLASRTEPLFVLDAGCGKGHFARLLSRCGHLVDAFDRSETAIEYCRTSGGGPRYSVSDLASWSAPQLYDVVLCVDVLFHLLDDEEWAAALRNLASLVRVTGRLLLTDHDGPDRRPLGTYIRHRPRADYLAVLEPLGLRHEEYRAYGFRDSIVGFHTYRRIS